MRLVQFFQVVLLLALAAYVMLVQLENPLLLRLPFPGANEAELPLGLVLALALLVGALYASLLYTPKFVQNALRHQREARERRALEAKLSTTLQAKLAATPVGQWAEDAQPDEGLTEPPEAPGSGFAPARSEP
ncbi:lipopolysaccharide assembly protein LapA domain-containing protein [Deinococcus peraridilitoris]|nr:lipopolysaccharide assembly protein LapA domain-containing protein [Deinococcus peraridilitoris]